MYKIKKVNKAIIGLIILFIVIVSVVIFGGNVVKSGKSNAVNLDVEYLNDERKNVIAFNLDYKVDTKEIQAFEFYLGKEKSLNFNYTSTKADSGIGVRIKNNQKKTIAEFFITEENGTFAQNLSAGNYYLEVTIPAKTEGGIYISWKE